MMDSSLTNPPVFIVGAPRSGTTWLQLLLSQSPSVASCNETHLFSSYLSSLFRSWAGFQKNIRSIGLHHIISESDYLLEIRRFSDHILYNVIKSKPGAKTILEKTPAHARHWEHILKVYPEARFVHIVRDPRSVVRSLRKAGQGWGAAWASPGVLDNAYLWRNDVLRAAAISSRTERYHLLTYEQLREEPVTNLMDLFSFIDVEESRESCEKYIRRCTINNIQKMADSGPHWDLRVEPEGFIGEGSTDGWKPDLSRREIALIECVTFPLAIDFGYEPSVASRRFILRQSLYSAFGKIEKAAQWYVTKYRQRL